MWVDFDQSVQAGGAYYTGGSIVKHAGVVCRVTSVRKKRGTKATAYLEEIFSPTDEQKEAADRWERSALGS